MTPADWIALFNAAAAAATPLTVLAVGHWLNGRVKTVEETVERNRRITATKFDLYKDIGFQLNDLYAYFNFIGLWKELSPANVIERKRHLDRHVFTFRPVLGEPLFATYIRFSRSMFVMYPGWNRDATLRTTSEHRKQHGCVEFLSCFTQEDNLVEINSAYHDLMNCLAAELDLELTSHDPRPSQSHRRRDAVDHSVS